MILSVTAIEKASRETPLVLRGPFAQTIAQAERLGIPGIELHLKDSDALDHRALARALSDHHVSLTSIGTGPSYSQDHIFFTHENPEVRQEAIRRMKSHIRLAQELGAVVIIGLIKGQKRDVPSVKGYEEMFDQAMTGLVAYAEQHETVLAFEVIDRFESDWLQTVDEGLALLKRYPSRFLKLHLDTFHMNIEEPDLPGAILRAGDAVGHVHVADSDRWYPGHAHYDFAQMATALKAIGYQGAVALESFQYPDPETACRRFVEHIGPLLAD